jgi:hypothetical protein
MILPQIRVNPPTWSIAHARKIQITQEETQKSCYFGERGAKWLPPILARDCFQPAIKGGARVKPAKNSPALQNNAVI